MARNEGFGAESGYGQISPYRKTKTFDPEADATQAAVQGRTEYDIPGQDGSGGLSGEFTPLPQTGPAVDQAYQQELQGTGQITPQVTPAPAAQAPAMASPGEGWVQVGGGWVPPGHPAAAGATGGATGGVTGGTTPGSANPYQDVLAKLQIGSGGIQAGDSGAILKQVLQQLLNKAAVNGALGNVPFTGVR